MSLQILVIEDTIAIGEQIVDYLLAQGCEVDFAARGKQGLSLARENHYDVIVLDWMLPDTDGIDVCEQIKHDCDPVPAVLMLTAKDALEDKSQGFAAGADDYLTKPFAPQELWMRCQALARRSVLHKSKTMRIGTLEVDASRKQVLREGIALPLSATDFHILMVLVDAYPGAVSRQHIAQKVWGEDLPDSDVLRSHIYTLRQALDKPFARDMLQTVRGMGFRLVACDAE